MAIVMQMHWPEVTAEQYRATLEAVQWETDVPKGARLHVAWMADDGFRVWDVWDSAADFDAFVNDRLTPGIVQVGIEGQPKVEILPCHAYQVEVMPAAGAVVESDLFPAVVYDAIAGKVDWAHVPPVGGVAHIAADADDGMVQTLSVWTSPAAHDAFGNDRIAPAARELAMEIPDDGPTSFHPMLRVFDALGGRAAG